MVALCCLELNVSIIIGRINMGKCYEEARKRKDNIKIIKLRWYEYFDFSGMLVYAIGLICYLAIMLWIFTRAFSLKVALYTVPISIVIFIAVSFYSQYSGCQRYE